MRQTLGTCESTHSKSISDLDQHGRGLILVPSVVDPRTGHDAVIHSWRVVLLRGFTEPQRDTFGRTQIERWLETLALEPRVTVCDLSGNA